MAHKVNNLNGDFGVIIEGVSREIYVVLNSGNKPINFGLKMAALLVYAVLT